MVTVVPPKMNLGSHIGQGAARGLERGFSEGFDIARQRDEQQYQRGMLQKGLDEAYSSLPESEQSRLQSTFAYLKATAGLPQSDRAAAALLPELARGQMYEAAKNSPSPGGSVSPQQGNRQGLQREEIVRGTPLPNFLGVKNAPSGQQQDVSGERGQGSLVPTAIGEGLIGNKYSAEEIKANPRLADMMRQYNQDQEAQTRSIENSALAQGNISSQRTQQQEKFREYVEKESPKLKGSDFQAFMKISEEPNLQEEPSFDKRYDKTKKKFDLYQSNKSKLIDIGQRESFDDKQYKTNLNEISRIGSQMVNNGQRDLFLQIAQDNLGLGPTEATKTINDLSPSQYKEISRLPNFKDVEKLEIKKAFLEGIDAPEAAYSINKEISDKKSEVEDKWRSWMQKNITPGEYDPEDPNQYTLGTNLLAMQVEAMKSGMNYKDFYRVLNDLVSQGKVKLGDYQIKDMINLSRPPINNLGEAELLWRSIPGYIERQ